MTKTFKSAVTAGREVLVDRRTYGVFVRVIHEDKSAGTTIAAADAPALALAILEAAGVEPADPMGCNTSFFAGPEHGAEYAVMWLRQLAEHQKATAKEAADREELEGEAWDLYLGGVDMAYSSWAEMPDRTRGIWLNVARKAREMYGATS